MRFRALGIKGQNEQKLLHEAQKPFKAKLKRIITRWSLQPESEA